jgi:hypothetical protein
MRVEFLILSGTKKNVPLKFKARAAITKFPLISLKSQKHVAFQQSAIVLLTPKAFCVSISGRVSFKLKKQAQLE